MCVCLCVKKDSWWGGGCCCEMQPLRIKNNNSWPSGRHDGEKVTLSCASSYTHMPAHLYIQHLVTLCEHCVNKVDFNKT